MQLKTFEEMKKTSAFFMLKPVNAIFSAESPYSINFSSQISRHLPTIADIFITKNCRQIRFFLLNLYMQHYNCKNCKNFHENGEVIIELSVYDAIQAGFDKVVFIIKKENEADFKEAIGKRVEKVMDVEYVFQDIHNIPEGLAVGVGFSGFAIGMNGCTLTGALMIALGIGIQNIPDGIAISVPLYRDGMSKRKAFLIGQSSGIMELIAAIIGYFITISIRSILPFFFTFAAGAMITVVISELIPDIAPENRTLSVLGYILGFTTMMILDLAITI